MVNRYREHPPPNGSNKQRQLRLSHGLGPFLVQSLTDVFSSLSQHMSAHVLVSEHALWICFLQDMNKFVEQRVVRLELVRTKAMRFGPVRSSSV